MKGVDRRFVSETSAGKRIVGQFRQREFDVSCSVNLSDAEASWFKTFVQDTLAGGVLPFEFPVWLGGELVWKTALLHEMPEASDLEAGRVIYNLSLTVW